jgi:hypothetical protein
MNDFDGWKQALKDHPDVTCKSYPNLNHLFMPGAGKSKPQEYLQPGHFDGGVVNDIADWILKS